MNTLPPLAAALLSALLLYLVPAEARAQQTMPWCHFHLHHASGIHLAPGESDVVDVRFSVSSSAPPATLPYYEWRFVGARLGAASPEAGVVQVERVLERPATATEEPDSNYLLRINFTFTAGQEPGSEHGLLIISSVDPDLRGRCRGRELAMPVTVGGEWSFASTYRSGGMMPLIQHQTGTFRIVDGTRIEGEGHNFISVRGACSFLDDVSTFRIGGSVDGGQLRLTLDHEESDVGDVQLLDEGPGCVMRSAIESLTLAGAVMGTVARGISCGALAFQVDNPEPWECDGIVAEVRRLGGN